MKIQTMFACIASLALLSACGEKAPNTEDAAKAAVDAGKTAVDAGKAAVAENRPMALPMTSSNDAARKHYLAGLADFDNSRLVSANKKFLAAAAADPTFTMAHLMSALTAQSTEGFVSNLNMASANKVNASRGEQALVEAWEAALAADAAGWTAAVKELTSLHPDSPRAWVFLGGAYQNVNNSTDARAAFAKAIALDPSFVPGHINLGNDYLTQEPKDFAKAEEHFRHAVALTPMEPNPHDLLGDVHRAQGNLKAAYDDYTKAAELAPELGSGLQQRGHVNSFLGNYKEARSDYSRAAELEDARGSSAGPSFLTFRAYVNLHEGEYDAAIAELQAIADSMDGSSMDGAMDLKVGALLNIALIAIEQTNSDVANAAIAKADAVMQQQADALDSEDVRDASAATVAYFEGMLAARLKDEDTAASKAAEFEQHVKLSSNPLKLQRMHEVLGMSAYCQDDYDGAIEHLSKGNTLNNMYAKYYLARAHEAAGNADEAARLYGELAVYNFNGPGYAMFRKDILARAAG